MTGKKLCFAGMVMSVIFTIGLTAKTDLVNSRWQNEPLRIDGDISDWAAPLFFTEKKAQVDFVFSNDDKSLFLLFIFKDATQVPNEQTGMTIWINGEGKTKKETGLCFNKKMIPATTLIAIMEKKNGPIPEDKKNEIMSKPAYPIIQFTAINKDGEDLTETLFKDLPRPVLQQKATASGQLAYEFAFPLISLAKLGFNTGKSNTLGFEWGGSAKGSQYVLQPQGYQSQIDTSEQADTDPSGSGAQSSGIRRMRGPKHFLFWRELALAEKK